MKAALADMLVDPVDLSPFQLEVVARAGEEIVDATLRSASGRTYAVDRGIPRFMTTQDEGQLQTMHSFGYKWRNESSYAWARQGGDGGAYAAWLSEKYGFDSAAAWCRHFAGKRFLDLGCGAGMASYFWLTSSHWEPKGPWVGVDISEAVDVAREQLGRVPNTHFVQADALNLPFSSGTFDAILSEGVLHHTPSTRMAIESAARVLAGGGELHFYVYRRKAPAREYMDDHVRERLRDLSDDEAWDAMRSLTLLARNLARLKAEVTVEEDVPLLGIKAGTQDVQRLIYWNFAKLYWNEAFDFEENVHVNFDWYRPVYAHRQSAEEVQAWCRDAGLEIVRMHEQESGYTVRAVKK
ncbi:MAG TPA: class I SAM-dependent methyltransferase [Candidatus Sulfotelmatobacter sp.]|nr:class I SAM-dependent methyltransferase [Candidatus Sulfotelmatobacter sp.]